MASRFPSRIVTMVDIKRPDLNPTEGCAGLRQKKKKDQEELPIENSVELKSRSNVHEGRYSNTKECK